MLRRSRGCQECRKRRIGCDGALPSCRQCLVTNRRCSGAMQGSIFVDQTRSVTSRHSQSLAQNRAQVMIRQPSPRDIFSLAFVSEFISSVTDKTAAPSRLSWLRQLEGIPQDKRGISLDLSLQAVSLAYCGVGSRNHPAVMEARRLYGEAMSQHSRELSQGFDSLSPAMLYTSIILSLFESMWSTSAAAYSIHLVAAQKMLDLACWDVTQNEILRQVTMHIQNQTLFMMIASPLDGVQQDLEARAWSGTLTSLLKGSQPVADQLTTQLFRLWKIVCARKSDADSNETALHLRNIGSIIATIWAAYQEDSIRRGEASLLGPASNAPYRDSLAALMEAYFASAQVMFSLAGPLAPSHSYLTSEDPCQVILRSASYLFKGRTAICCVGHDVFLPLTLLALHGTSVKYRRMAYAFLEEEIPRIPFKGLREIAIQRIKSVDVQDRPKEHPLSR